jgi:hypothetical protein
MSSCNLLILLLLWPASLFAQVGGISSSYRLDTIVSSGVQRSESFQRILCVAVSPENEAWTYVPSPESADTMLFVRLDLKTHKCSRFSVLVPGLQLQLAEPRYRAIAANRNTLAVLFGHLLVTFNLVRSPRIALSYKSSMALHEPFDYVGLDDSLLLLGREFDYDKETTPKSTLL